MNKNTSKNQIIKGTLLSYVFLFLNGIIGLIFVPFLIKSIGSNQYAIYSLSLFIVIIFSFDFGFSTSIVRFVPEINDENEQTNFYTTMFIFFIPFIFLTLIAYFLYFNNLNVIYTDLDSSSITQLKVILERMTLILFSILLLLPVNGILLANERYSFYRLIQIIQRLFALFLMYLVLKIGFSKDITFHLIYVNFLTISVSQVIKLLYALKQKLFRINFKFFRFGYVRLITPYLIWSSLIIFTQSILFSIGPNLLARRSTTYQVALYAISLNIESQFSMFANSLNSLFLPLVVKMSNVEKNFKGIFNLTVLVGKYQSFFIYLTLVGFIVLGKDFIYLWLGETFKDVYWITLFLLIPLTFSLTQQVSNNALDASNLIKLRALSISMSLIWIFISSAYLIKSYGGIGMALSMLSGNVIVLAFNNYLYTTKLHFNFINFIKESHLKFLIPSLLSAFIGIILNLLLININIVSFIIKILTITIIFTSSVWFISLENLEKNYIKSTFNQIFPYKFVNK